MNKVTEVQIIPIKPNNGLIGFASIVIDESLYLSSIGIYRRIDGMGYRITYPTKKVGEKSMDIFHPIQKELGKLIEKAIIEKTSKIF